MFSLHWFLAIICFPSQNPPAKVGRRIEVEDDGEEEEKENAECQKDEVDEARKDKRIDSEVGSLLL